MASITDGLGLPVLVLLLLSSWRWPSWPPPSSSTTSTTTTTMSWRKGVVLVADLDRLLYRPGELGLVLHVAVVPLRGVGGDDVVGEPQVRAQQ